MPYTESDYEDAVLQLFTQTLGYAYVYGPDVERDYRSPLYEEVLAASLQELNPGLPQRARWCRRTGSSRTICRTACR